MTDEHGSSTSSTAVRSGDDGPATMSPWLWLIYPIANGAMFMVWGGVMQVLLGKQVAAIVPGAAASAAALGTVTSIASISSVISQPVVGWLSDHTKVKFLGRRNVWIFGAGIVGVIGLMLQSQIHSTLLLTISWAAMMWPLNSVQAALTTVLPERVPVKNRGFMSGLLGSTNMVGSFIGVALAGLSPKVFNGYVFICAIFLAITQIFAWTTKDISVPTASVKTDKKAVKGGKLLPGFKEARNYWWTFIARFFMVFGYFVIMSFQLYILRDHIGIGDINKASAFMVSLTGFSTVLGVIASALGGFIADKVGHLALFVGASTLIMVPGGFVYWLVPSKTGAWIATAFIGLGYGSYMAVDQALTSRVLPNVANAGRDLGIMNIANAGPQVMAPAVTGAIVGATGSYTWPFVLMIVFCILAAITICFVKGLK
ncbi:MFS transporter [Bifidobacterium sp. ESL0764]|uniref:MFS transporter n=1 Tax=Bifidobacterium sp. ESL0764 TaxID=2983228 RepID=UPI0023F9B89B|nr:MFS transporter [Bifidobacterium sp. ESL0764]WEV65893.1 MFS transporter [Bifidobacterium sp. ESL0764]